MTPDWAVTRKNRGRIGTPISLKTRQRVKNDVSLNKKRTKKLRLVPLIIFPQCELQHRIVREIIVHQLLPER